MHRMKNSEPNQINTIKSDEKWQRTEKRENSESEREMSTEHNITNKQKNWKWANRKKNVMKNVGTSKNPYLVLASRLDLFFVSCAANFRYLCTMQGSRHTHTHTQGSVISIRYAHSQKKLFSNIKRLIMRLSLCAFSLSSCAHNPHSTPAKSLTLFACIFLPFGFHLTLTFNSFAFSFNFECVLLYFYALHITMAMHT